MELVKINGIIGKVISTDNRYGTFVIEYFEGVEYDNVKKLIVATYSCKRLSTEFNIGDKVRSSSGDVLTIVGYSGTYSLNDVDLAIVFSEHTWGSESEYKKVGIGGSKQCENCGHSSMREVSNVPFGSMWHIVLYQCTQCKFIYEVKE